ncbi:MAG: DUF6607 family protein [Verrucomicrobiota bacterium]
MRYVLAAILACTAIASAAASPAADRAAILAMAGTFTVDFSFRETAAIARGYELRKPYHESGTELVVVAEDSPAKITLQHILVVTGPDKENHVIKHWAQTWTWQDTNLVDYHGTEGKPIWKKIRLTPEQAAGTWSQLVTSVDDTPRYEGYGKWTHENGESHWQSNPTRRPLPRREATTRDDYDHLLVTNRHTITPTGWLHLQDNRKIIDRPGQPVKTLCYEFGLNTYNRADRPEADAAATWWKQHRGFWTNVRHFWTDQLDKTPASFTYLKKAGSNRLSRTLGTLQDENAPADAITTALTPFLIIE